MDNNNSNKLDNFRANLLRTKHMLTGAEQTILKHTLKLDDQTRAITTKLVVPKGTPNRDTPEQAVDEVFRRTASDVADIESIRRALPESETAKDILTTAIISPHDGVTEELNWTLSGGFPAEVGNRLLGVVQTYFETDVDINSKLQSMLGNALFDRGSHILAVLPESSIDDIINSRSTAAMESYSITNCSVDGRLPACGLLGEGLLHSRITSSKIPSNIALESYYGNNPANQGYYSDIIPGLLRITDNPDILKINALERKVRKDRIKQVHRQVAMESAVLFPEQSAEEESVMPVTSFYRRIEKLRAHDPLAVVNDRDNSSRKSIGHALLVEPPHECCVPVHVPGRPEHHVGYLFLLDQNGSFITYNSARSTLNSSELNAFAKAFGSNNQTVTHQTISELGKAVGGSECATETLTLEQLSAFYTRIIERDLKARLNSALHGEEAEIDAPEEIYRIMLARTLAGTMTQLLYLPESLVSYLAFYYNDFGIGQSLITRAKAQAALRISTVYANNYAVVKNAIGTRTLKIQLDPIIQNTDEYVANVLAEHIQRNSNQMLFRSLDPAEISRSFIANSIEVVVEGNDAVDSTRIETEYKTGDRPLIDNDFNEQSKRALTDAWMIPPKLFDDNAEVQFSSEFITSNIFFMKRNRNRAVIFNRFITDAVKKATLHDGTLISEMSAIVREEYTKLGDELIDEARRSNSTIPVIEAFLDDLEVGVPLPDTESQESTAEAFNTYMGRIERYLPALLDSSVMSSFVSETDPAKKQEVMGQLEGVLKSIFAHHWIQQNNAFQELRDIMYVDGQMTPEILKGILDSKRELSELVGELLNQYFERANPPEGGEQDTSTPAPAASGTGDEFNTEGGDDNKEEEDDPLEFGDPPSIEEPEENKEEKKEDEKPEDEKASDSSSSDNPDAELEKALDES